VGVKSFLSFLLLLLFGFVRLTTFANSQANSHLLIRLVMSRHFALTINSPDLANSKLAYYGTFVLRPQQTTS